MGPYELSQEEKSAGHRIHPTRRSIMQHPTRLVACPALVIQFSRKLTHKCIFPK